MTDFNDRKKMSRSKTGLKRNLSQLSNIIRTNNSQNDLEYKSRKYKYHKSIRPHNCKFITSNQLLIYSSSDTLDKKKPTKAKRKIFRNSERVVTNYKIENEEIEEDSEEEQITPKKNISNKTHEINILSLAYKSQRKNPKIDIIKNYNNDKYDLKPENYLYIPYKLKKKLDILSIKIIYPVDNKYGKYTKYVQNVAKSLKDFIHLDYDSIFSEENLSNVKYLIYDKLNNNNNKLKKLLLLDLDETLVHSEFRNPSNYKSLDKMKENSRCYNRSFSYIEDNYKYYFDIYFRPYLFDFLHEIKYYFDLAIFTASSKRYADTVIDYIDPNNELFKFRLYREACIPIQKFLFIKDLRIIKNYDPMNVILMDNSFYSFINQPSNGMLIYSFYSNYKDNQLIHAKNFLIKYIYPSKDVRIEIEKWFQFSELLGKKIPIDDDIENN